MIEIPRLNPAIRALEAGKPAFASFAIGEVSIAQTLASSSFDAVVFEMEHMPFDIGRLRDCFQYMLNRRQILDSGSLAPSVAPLVRIPPNGAEMNQWLAKQVLDVGAYGIIWPHVSTVEEARNAVSACRYPRPPTAANYEPAGVRGDAPMVAARYWGLTQKEYYERADVWPLAPSGEILVGIMCEEVKAVKNLPAILKEVPGIGVVLIGEGDLSQELGQPRNYTNPVLLSAIKDVLAICSEHNVPCGHPHVDTNNVETLIKQGFRWLMPQPTQSYAALELGRRKCSRT